MWGQRCVQEMNNYLRGDCLDACECYGRGAGDKCSSCCNRQANLTFSETARAGHALESTSRSKLGLQAGLVLI